MGTGYRQVLRNVRNYQTKDGACGRADKAVRRNASSTKDQAGRTCKDRSEAEGTGGPVQGVRSEEAEAIGRC